MIGDHSQKGSHDPAKGKGKTEGNPGSKSHTVWKITLAEHNHGADGKGKHQPDRGEEYDKPQCGRSYEKKWEKAGKKDKSSYYY